MCVNQQLWAEAKMEEGYTYAPFRVQTEPSKAQTVAKLPPAKYARAHVTTRMHACLAAQPTQISHFVV